jgi:hypothetical protein
VELAKRNKMREGWRADRARRKAEKWYLSVTFWAVDN